MMTEPGLAQDILHDVGLSDSSETKPHQPMTVCSLILMKVLWMPLGAIIPSLENFTSRSWWDLKTHSINAQHSRQANRLKEARRAKAIPDSVVENRLREMFDFPKTYFRLLIWRRNFRLLIWRRNYCANMLITTVTSSFSPTDSAVENPCASNSTSTTAEENHNTTSRSGRYFPWIESTMMAISLRCRLLTYR